jgi:peptidoglycan-associated lipoprotein
MKKVFSIILIAVVSFSAFAQKNSTLDKADKLFNKRAYFEAAALYKASAIESKHVLQNLGDCFYYNNQMNDASEVYEKLFRKYNAKEIDPAYLFRFSQALKGIKNYARYDELLMKNAGSKESIESVLASLDDNLKYDFTVLPLKYKLEGSNFGANYYGENKLIFATTSNKNRPSYLWNNKPYLDLIVGTIKDQDKLDDFEYLSDAVNTDTHESSAVITKDGKTMYFSRTAKKKVKVGEYKIANVKLFKADLIDGKWTNVKVLPFSSDYYSTQHPALNDAENKLYFSSDMPGTLGSFDIFEVDIYKDGTYGIPKNLGSAINTEQREQFPFMSKENVLYFSSTGFVGFGGLDIFSSKLKDGVFQAPLNLGRTINSGLDDFAFIINEDTNRGYFSSDKSGNDRIYSFIRVERVLDNVIVKGIIKNLFTSDIVSGAMVSLLNEKGQVAAGQVVGEDGQYRLTVPNNAKYLLKVEHNEFNIQERPVTLDESFDPSESLDVMLEPVNKVKFKSEYFTRGTVKSLVSGEPLLGTLVSLYDEDGILMDSQVVDERGRFTFDLEPNKNYALSAHRDNFDVFERKFTINDTDLKSFSYDILMSPTKVKSVGDDVVDYKVPNILFDFDKAVIRPDAVVILDKLITYLKDNTSIKVEIGGHTDAYGYDEYNMRLSQRRSNAAADYLIRAGIEKNRINTAYFGKKLPLNGCIKEYVCTKEQYRINRRCEFTLVK